MKKQILLISVLIFSLLSCNNPVNKNSGDLTSFISQLTTHKENTEELMRIANDNFKDDNKTFNELKFKYSEIKTAQNTLINELVTDIRLKNKDFNANSYQQKINLIEQTSKNFKKYLDNSLDEKYKKEMIGSIPIIPILEIGLTLSKTLYDIIQEQNEIKTQELINTLNSQKILSYTQL